MAEESHVAVVVGEAAAVASVGGAVVAAEGAAEGVDEDGWTMGGEVVVVAVAGVVAPSDFGGIMMPVVYALQPFDIGGGLRGVGVDDHEAVVAATEEVDVDQQLHLAVVNQGVPGEVVTADEAAFLAAEE